MRSTEARPVLTPETAVYVAGHTGLVGSALVRALQRHGCGNLLLPTHRELDLTNQHAVDDFFTHTHPQVVFLAAARVGGILANATYPADFLYENMMIEANVIHAAHCHGVEKLLFLGSSCIYPRNAPQPLKEEYLLTGPLEPTNATYAVAKIAGIRLCQAYARQHGANFISVMPTNLYGPHDNFDPTTSHALPALLRKMHQAKEEGSPTVTVWGTGRPRREFLHVDDLAEACLFLMDHYDDSEILNVGTGEDLTIADLAELIRQVVGYEGGLRYDAGKPDGAPRKLLDISRITNLGWKPRIPLRTGLIRTYDWFVAREAAR